MTSGRQRVALFLPAQAAAETEATILKWYVSTGEEFRKGRILAEAESAKSSFQFDAPCSGSVAEILVAEGETVAFEKPVIEVETDESGVGERKPVAPPDEGSKDEHPAEVAVVSASGRPGPSSGVGILGIGAYLPRRVVGNKDLLEKFPDVTEEYIFGVTGIRERRWASPEEKPSDMAFAAARDAIRASGLKPDDIHGIIVSTTTPDYAMPATACLLQEKLGIKYVPSFDLNAACSGWLYALSTAKGLIHSGLGNNILVVGVDMQSRMLQNNDRSAYFLFGDGAGATVVSDSPEAHVIREEILAADSRGLRMARREFPGYEIPENIPDADPWIRLDGRALFKFATESFSSIVRQVIEKSGWEPTDVKWVVPHQANGRILKAAARKSGVPFERFYLNIDRVGNTSSASIPLALIEVQKFISRSDKLVLCSVGAGITYAAISVEW